MHRTLKPRPNDERYIAIQRRMTPEQRLKKAFELTELGRDLFRQGLKRRFPDLPPDAFQALYLERLSKCHNQNY